MLSLATSLLLVPVVLALLLIVRRIALAVTPTPRHGGVPRPPFVGNWIPFMGSAISMASGDSFWTRVNAKYGPVVRATAAGDTRTFITSPALISYIYKHSKNFQFHWFRKNIQSIAFGTPLEKSFSNVWEDKIYPAHHRALQPGSIRDLIAAYANELESELSTRLASAEGKVVDLHPFIFELIYLASSKALFSSTFPAAATYKDFVAFDKTFPILLLSSAPAFVRSGAEGARKKMLDHIESWWASLDQKQRGAVMPSVSSMTEIGEEEGWTNRDVATVMLGELWALGANAPFAAVWAILEINRRPELVRLLRKEVQATIDGLSPPTLSTLLRLPQPELVQALPTLNAVFQETLRFYSDSGSLRVVQEDCVLPAELCTGGPGEKSGLALLAGEQVVCVTRVHALDAEGTWGEDAGGWDYTRWLNGEKRGSMNPFGGGVSMCEGRHFASAEILTLIASFLMLVDFEIVEDTVIVDVQRIGLGIQHPKGKARVKVSRRAKA